MPGPPKTNPKNTTGLRIPKSQGKQARSASFAPAVIPDFGAQHLNKYMDDLRKEMEYLRAQHELHEQKLNRMQVDATTKVVTFIV